MVTVEPVGPDRDGRVKVIGSREEMLGCSVEKPR